MIALAYLIILLVIAVALAFIVRYAVDVYQRKRDEAIKRYVNAVVSLSTSHLHDASNFFSLIKSNLEDGESTDMKSFSKGAAYHFRSLFEELRSSQSSLEELGLDYLMKNKFDLFYKKEKIDLKDLLELELFQVSDFRRLKIIDNTSKMHAFVHGNFSLLSKTLLNLVENALKYTDEDINLELNERSKGFEIKIFSLGSGIPEKVVNDIKESPLPKHSGHGLESLRDIMSFHNAKFDISTIPESGSCVCLSFLPFEKAKVKKDIKLSVPKLKFQATLMQKMSWQVPAFVFVFLFALSSFNHFMLSRTYRNEVLRPPVSKTNIEQCSYTLDRLIDELGANDLLAYRDIEESFISGMDERRRDFVSLIIYEHIKDVKSIYVEDFLNRRALGLVKRFPNEASLNYRLSEFSFKRKKFRDALTYSLRGFLSITGGVMFPAKDSYFLSRLFKDNSFERFLALSINDQIELEEPEEEAKFHAKAPVRKDSLIKQNDGIKELKRALPKDLQSEDSSELLNSMEKMLEAKNAELGIDLNL